MFVESQNLHRRHLTAEFRDERIRQMRAAGASYRVIEKELKVGKHTIQKAIASGVADGNTLQTVTPPLPADDEPDEPEAVVERPAPAPPPAPPKVRNDLNDGTVTPVTVETTDGKVIGKDGKARPATRPEQVHVLDTCDIPFEAEDDPEPPAITDDMPEAAPAGLRIMN